MNKKLLFSLLVSAVTFSAKASEIIGYPGYGQDPEEARKNTKYVYSKACDKKFTPIDAWNIARVNSPTSQKRSPSPLEDQELNSLLLKVYPLKSDQKKPKTKEEKKAIELQKKQRRAAVVAARTKAKLQK